MNTNTKSDAELAAASCGCPHKCQRFELLPLDQGIMITLHLPSSSSSSSTSNTGDSNNDVQKAIDESPKHPCTCLKLHPQQDANLSQFHPNIYIPASLLDYPEHLVKHGGGGSGVTVFGGYHPLLGNLVMKHGGHKDLIELVSLAKIEREIRVRCQWKLDRLKNSDGSKDHGRDTNNMSQTEHPFGSDSVPHNKAHKHDTKKQFAFMSSVKPSLESFTEEMNEDDDDNNNNNITTGEDGKPGQNEQEKKKRHTFTSTTKAGNSPTNKRAGLPKVASQPILAVGTMMRRMGGLFSSEDNLTFRRGGAALSERGSGNSLDKVCEFESKELQKEFDMHAVQHAMEDMKRRIPAFRMIYISPMHVRERKEELKNRTFRSSSSQGGSARAMDETDQKESEGFSPSGRLLRSSSSVLRRGRHLHLFGSENTTASSIKVRPDHVEMCFGGSYYRCKSETDEFDSVSQQQGEASQEQKAHSCRSRADGSDGYATLMAFVDHLCHQQRMNEWKITLAQQTIGQVVDANGQPTSAPTASSLLARGELHGKLLHHLIDSEIQVIHNLQLLTMNEETDVTETVRAEYDAILYHQKKEGIKVSAAEVSPLMNDFVGKAIIKNFHPTTGRFAMLKQFGIDLRKGRIHLKQQEMIPAKHLENIFYRAWKRSGDHVEGANDGDYNGHGLMEETFGMHFHDTHDEQGDRRHPHHCDHIFEMGMDQWQSLVELALSIKHPNAISRIWNCGLADGGLHNMFLSDNDQWLFDLGSPNLEPTPAFLTKFLMSFFHTLGMEEDEKGDWVVRFEQDDSGKLRLTEKTQEMLPKIMNAFNTTMDRLIKELFGGEDGIRIVLLRYVITQLISDAAFCIEKWRVKGGGDEQRSEHQYFLEKWLWRALWDIYASEEIRRRYLTRTLLRRQMECRDLSSANLMEGLND